MQCYQLAQRRDLPSLSPTSQPRAKRGFSLRRGSELRGEWRTPSSTSMRDSAKRKPRCSGGVNLRVGRPERHLPRSNSNSRGLDLRPALWRTAPTAQREADAASVRDCDLLRKFSTLDFASFCTDKRTPKQPLTGGRPLRRLATQAGNDSPFRSRRKICKALKLAADAVPDHIARVRH